jgi:hypothetical protein
MRDINPTANGDMIGFRVEIPKEAILAPALYPASNWIATHLLHDLIKATLSNSGLSVRDSFIAREFNHAIGIFQTDNPEVCAKIIRSIFDRYSLFPYVHLALYDHRELIWRTCGNSAPVTGMVFTNECFELALRALEETEKSNRALIESEQERLRKIRESQENEDGQTGTGESNG